MSYDQILALIATLMGGQPDTTAFQQLIEGGYEPAIPVKVEPCPRPLGRAEIEGQTIICGTVSVPEDHAAPDGRRLDLFFTVLKSHSFYPEPDPLVHLHGGPGSGILVGIEGFAGLFDPWRQTRDIVMFDQRAAGLSGRSTTCYDALTVNVVDIAKGTIGKGEGDDGGPGVTALIADCMEELKADGVGLSNYNTYQNALDVRAIVSTLGYRTYNLYGISYGTKLTLEVMRSAPEGLRSVVVDGVAPPSVHLYDTLAVPQDEAIVTFLAECAANTACNKAYPELAEKLEQAFANAEAGKVVLDGKALPPAVVSILFDKRNGDFRHGSITGYLPAMIYEMARGGDMPTLKMLGDQDMTIQRPGPDQVRQAAAQLTDEQKRIVDLALADAAVVRNGNSALDLTMDTLKDLLRRDRELGPLAALFDQEMSKASGPLLADPKRARAAVVDYAALQNATPSKDLLRDFVSKHFEDEGRDRLLALVDAMSDAELRGAFDAIRAATGRYESSILGNAHLFIYACQEDVPYNSMEGYEKTTDALTFPQIRARWDKVAKEFYSICSLFEPQERSGFHESVVSDIPTLSLGSTWDTQTAASWAALAAKTLSNSQTFVIPEAGHGAIIYQHCAVDMGVAFINNPMRKLDNKCPQSAKPSFYIAPWVEK